MGPRTGSSLQMSFSVRSSLALICGGAVPAIGNPRPPQVKDNQTSAQEPVGGDGRPEPFSGSDESYSLPEGLRRKRQGPLNKDNGRRPKKI
jgi:hypothetical protein